MHRLLGALFPFLGLVLPLLAYDSAKQAHGEISVTATSAPSAFVNHVNTIFGNLLLSSVDLAAAGPHSLPIIRYYNTRLISNRHGTWIRGIGMSSNYPQWIRGFPVEEGDKYAYMTAEEDGGSIICGVSKFHEKEMSFYLDPQTIHSGLTNASEDISARTNLKNTHFKIKGHWIDSKKYGRYLKAKWTAFLSNGGVREYFPSLNFEDAMNLHQETKPDGTKLVFDYYSSEKLAGWLKEIVACNHSHQHTFAWLKVDYRNGHEKEHVTSSTGKEVTYGYDMHSVPEIGKAPFLETVHSPDLPTTKYSYENFHGRRYLSKISLPEGRYLSIDYDKEGRVTKQKAPVGNDGEEKTIFTFEYHPKDRKTEVYDAKDRKTVYRYSSRDRLTAIEKYTEKKLYRGEGFVWGKKESTHCGERDESDEGHLLAKTVYDDDRKALLGSCFEYDSHGNITEETLYGNLTGDCTKRFDVTDEGQVDRHHIEHYSKQYSYSNDRLHLKTRQKEDDGTKIEYEYQKDTDLLTAQFIYDGHRIARREFFEYDNDAVLIKKIIDNGSSPHASHLTDVTERRITYIKPVRDRDNHGVGQPERITEWFLDPSTGKEHKLKTTEFAYTKAGLVEKEAVYDARDHHRYTLKTKYDSHGLPIQKTDAIGREFRFEYDDNFNKIREELVDSGVYTKFHYDKANRLTKKIDHHSDGLTLSTSYTYDSVGNLRSMTDPFGQTTKYEYDDLNRLCSISYPSVVDLKAPTEEKKYDLFNNVCSHTDQNGNTVRSTYTVRNQPLTIRYPDGSSEKFEYNLNGTLAKKWDRNGSRHKFSYDYQGRILSEKIFDSSGTLLSGISHTYDAFHLTSSTDPMGYTTSFTYDGAGRLIRIQKEDHLTDYGYDSLGRRLRTFETTGEGQYVETIEERDLLDRVIEVRSRFSDGRQLSLKQFTYDIRGNCTDVRSYTSETNSSTVHTDFSTRNLPIRIIDPLGNATQISYDYSWKNDLGQKVLYKLTRDPLGNQTIEIFDARSFLDTVEKKSADGTLLAKTVFRYDGKGNKTQEREYVVVNGSVVREYLMEWTYTPMDQVSALVEQPRTPDEKATRYTYTPAGLVATITKPDGVVIAYTYDALMRLASLQSSDGTIDHSYTYDLNNNPTTVVDGRNKITYNRSFDRFGHVLEETLWPGTSVQYSYDRAGRCTAYGLNGHPMVAYEYKNGHLTDVIRQGSSGKEVYRHRYTGIDFEERVVESALIHNLGAAKFSWDVIGRCSSIETPYWKETIPANGYDKAGNLRESLIQDGLGEVGCRYEYDNLYQLIHEEGVITSAFSYDSICNRLKKNNTDYQLNGLNRIVSESSSQYRYDANGNLIELNTLVLSYDGLDRCIAVEKTNSFRVEFFYDPWHRRVCQRRFDWNDGWQQRDECRFLYFGTREVGTILPDNSLAEFRALGRGKGAELGASVAIELKGNVYCPIHDHRGNITALVDASTGHLHETYRYSAFGEEQLFDAHGHSVPTVVNPWRFASKRSDPKSGLIFFGRRYYSRELGRFLTPDPVGFTDGPNLYAYVHNNPVVLFDPYGLTAIDDAEMAGIDTAKGTAQGFVHPLDTLYDQAGYLVQFGHDVYNGDFSRYKNASAADVVRFATARAGEATGMAMAMVPVAKMASAVIRVGTSVVGAFARSLVSRVGVRAAEKSVAEVAESRIATAVEARAAVTTEIGSETATAASTKIGAPSHPIWTATNDRTSVQNALYHWNKHGNEFSGIQNSKEFVEHAWKFRDRTDVLTKVRTNGERLLYDPSSNTFGAFTKSGVPKTIFKPDRLDYFSNQKGTICGN